MYAFQALCWRWSSVLPPRSSLLNILEKEIPAEWSRRQFPASVHILHVNVQTKSDRHPIPYKLPYRMDCGQAECDNCCLRNSLLFPAVFPDFLQYAFLPGICVHLQRWHPPCGIFYSQSVGVPIRWYESVDFPTEYRNFHFPENEPLLPVTFYDTLHNTKNSFPDSLWFSVHDFHSHNKPGRAAADDWQNPVPLGIARHFLPPAYLRQSKSDPAALLL